MQKKDSQTETQANRRAAVYGLVRSENDELAQRVVVWYTREAGYDVAEYVDKAAPCPGKPSAWGRLLDDIAKGLFYGVTIWQVAEGMLEYCDRYGTRLAVVDDPFALLGVGPVDRRKVRMI